MGAWLKITDDTPAASQLVELSIGMPQPEHQPRARDRWQCRGEMRSSTSGMALAERERDVLREMAFGRTNKEIALTTVKSHLSAILNKLGVDSRTQAALHALRSQMV